MWWFRKRQDRDEIPRLLARIGALEAALRTLETEQASMHEQVVKHMRRAVQAERNARQHADDSRRAPGAAEPPVIAVGTPLQTRRSMWGARRRIAERRARQGTLGIAPEENGDGHEPEATTQED